TTHEIETLIFFPAQSDGAPDTVSVNVSQFTPSTQVLSPLETPPAAVAVQVTGCEVGVIVPEVGLAAPSRITLSRQMKLATKNPPAKIHRIFFIERLPRSRIGCGLCCSRVAVRRVFACGDTPSRLQPSSSPGPI